MEHKKKSLKSYLITYILLIFGSFLAAVGLDIFLIPNNIIDGGVVGVSIMASYLSELPLGLFLVVFNLPFLYVGYKQIGKSFAFATLFSIILLSIWTTLLHNIPRFTNDLFLASVFGGIILGAGVGVIIRYGGSLDGTEIIAIILDKKTSFSVGEIVMFFNIFILGSAGLVFSWDRAMYSLVTYFIVYKVIDVVIQGFDESKAIFIISDKSDEIASTLMHRLGRGVTVIKGAGGYSGIDKKILYSVVTRLEISKLKAIVADIDDKAFVTINDVHDVMGGRMMKKAIH